LRTILYTGKGGVGKTSVAAATALKAAQNGKKVLVMSTDPAHSLSDAFDAEVGAEPKEMATGLFAQEMQYGRMLEEYWAEIQEYMTTFYEWQGADPLTAEELAMLPGMDELFGLLMVRRHYKEALYDALIVDAAPTGETLRLLVEDILTDPEEASVRLVVNAEKMVIAEARRAYTYLNLYDYAVDAVVVNRLLPEAVSDPYFEKWHEAQGRHMRAIEDSFSPIPIFKARLFDREMYGFDALAALAEDVFGNEEPLRVFFRGATHEIVKSNGGYEVVFNLPLVEKKSVDLSKKGAELLVRVGGYKRNVLLPDSMIRMEAAGAKIEGDKLKVRLSDGGV
jgi:arsenite-transporting ATPase